MIIKPLGLQAYNATLKAMQNFTDARDETTADELWIVEHPSIFTLGQAGKDEHVLNPLNIPVIRCDRGGQVTYHGPGQLIIYILIDLRRKKISVRDLVCHLEKSVIKLLKNHGVDAYAKREAPGVYVNHKKICSLGLRVRRGCTFHGLALNVDMDLEPFTRINPCGYTGLKMTQCSDLNITAPLNVLAQELCQYIMHDI